MNASASGKRGRQFAKVVGVAVVIAAIGTSASSLLRSNASNISPENNPNIANVVSAATAITQPVAQAALSGCSLNLQFNTIRGSAAKQGRTEYLLTAKNLGTSTCANVKLSLYYAVNERFISSSPRSTAGGYYWTLGDLAAGTTTKIILATIRSAPLASTESSSEACLTADNSQNLCANALLSGQTSSSGTISSVPKSTSAPTSPAILTAPVTPATTTQSNSATYAPQGGSSAPGAVAPSVTATPAPTPSVANSTPSNPAPASSQAPITDPTSTTPATPTTTTAVQDPPPLPQSPSGKDNGVWEWTSAYNMSQAAAQQIVNNAAASNFNVIYMTVDSSLNISGAQLANYEASLNTLLTLAAAQNIAVEAEAGASDWSQPANWSKPQAIMDFVANYNQSHDVKFRGVQFDIEPYTTTQYTTDQAGTLTDYVNMAESLVGKAKADGLTLGLVIPSFYDGGAGATPKITVDGITDYTYNHLVRLLGELPNGRIYVMAYRNFASGPNGTIDLSQAEISIADSSNVKVVIGQETGNVQPSIVTFFGMTKAQMAAQVAIVNQTYANDPSFAGIAVDYLEPYMQLQ